ncbi:MAG: putative quinol monooxygenase [Limisphaerales bacterium]
MSNASIVSIHPYFKVQDGKLEEFKSLLPEFVAKTSTEEGCLYYHFTIDGDVVFCREAYVDGDAALAHLDNVGQLLEQALGLAELQRLELHGGEAELAKLRESLVGMNPQWFVFQDGVGS